MADLDFDSKKMADALAQLHARRGDTGPMGPPGLPGVSGPAPQHTLEVRDVERLAKAGVAINFEQIKQQIRPDNDTRRSPFADGDLIRPLFDRWTRATPERDASMFMAWAGAAFKIGTKVQVMLCTSSRAVLLEDDYALYPSDALLASLIMMLKTETPGP